MAQIPLAVGQQLQPQFASGLGSWEPPYAMNAALKSQKKKKKKKKNHKIILFQFFRMAKIKSQAVASSQGFDCGKKSKPLVTGGIKNTTATFASSWPFLKKLNIELPMTQQFNFQRNQVCYMLHIK